MDYDRSKIPETYNQGRDHGPAFLEQWMRVTAERVNPARTRDILDLGCGTGRFSNALAAHFDATLIGIDPSLKMLQQALKARTGRLVVYAAGYAEAVPLPRNSVDMIFSA